MRLRLNLITEDGELLDFLTVVDTGETELDTDVKQHHVGLNVGLMVEEAFNMLKWRQRPGRGIPPNAGAK